jgi:hypothetical protein
MQNLLNFIKQQCNIHSTDDKVRVSFDVEDNGKTYTIPLKMKFESNIVEVWNNHTDEYIRFLCTVSHVKFTLKLKQDEFRGNAIQFVECEIQDFFFKKSPEKDDPIPPTIYFHFIECIVMGLCELDKTHVSITLTDAHEFYASFKKSQYKIPLYSKIWLFLKRGFTYYENKGYRGNIMGNKDAIRSTPLHKYAPQIRGNQTIDNLMDIILQKPIDDDAFMAAMETTDMVKAIVTFTNIEKNIDEFGSDSMFTKFDDVFTLVDVQKNHVFQKIAMHQPMKHSRAANKRVKMDMKHFFDANVPNKNLVSTKADYAFFKRFLTGVDLVNKIWYDTNVHLYVQFQKVMLQIIHFRTHDPETVAKSLVNKNTYNVVSQYSMQGFKANFLDFYLKQNREFIELIQNNITELLSLKSTSIPNTKREFVKKSAAILENVCTLLIEKDDTILLTPEMLSIVKEKCAEFLAFT